MITDTELLLRYATKEDESAFLELVDRNLAVVYQAALWRLQGNTHLAEEAAQMVFTQLAYKAEQLGRHPALLGWLYTSARYAASTLARREQRRIQHEQIAAAMPIESSEQPSWESLRPMLDDALEQLAERDRHAIVLRYFADRSHGQIGAELRISEEAARKCVDRAVNRLRAVLARRGITTTATALALAMSAASAAGAPPALASQIASIATTTATVMAIESGSASGIAFWGGGTKVLSVAWAALSIAAALIIGGSVAGWWFQQNRELDQLNGLQAETTAIHARLIRLSQERRAKSDGKTATRGANAGREVDPVIAMLISNLRSWEQLANDPIYATVREWEFRLRAQREFGALMAAHRYSTAQATFLRAALARYYDAAERVRMEAKLSGINGSPDPKQVAAAELAQEQKLFDALKNELDDGEILAIRRCYSAQQQMSAVEAVSRQLAFEGAPLDRNQELSLALLMADTAAAEQRMTSLAREQARRVDINTGLNSRDRSFVDAAARFLSAKQLQLYADHLRQEQVRSEMTSKVRSQVASETTP